MTDLDRRESEFAEVLLPPDVAPAAARPLAGGREIVLAGETMGTVWKLAAVAPAAIGPGRLEAALECAFSTVIEQMSQWVTDSEISRFNRAAAGTTVAVSPQFAHVIDCAVTVAKASDGAFDPTVGAASDLWGFGSGDEPRRVPSAREAAATRHWTWRDLGGHAEGSTLVQPGGLRLDLSAIAKGYAVDLAMDHVRSSGVEHALIEIGGELRGMGVQASGQPWWVDLEAPPSSQARPTRIGLCGWAVATSGNYRRRRSVEKINWSHTIDPRTGLPRDDEVLSVSVVHKGCMQADALATALMVMGPLRGMEFADRHGLPARIVGSQAVAVSAAWQRWLD